MAFLPGQSGNPAGRPRGSVNKALAMLRQSAEAVIPLVLARALGGDFEAMKLLIERGVPKLKPIDAPLEFTMPEAGASSPARDILIQVAAGDLPMSCAKELVGTLMPVVEQEEKATERKAHSSGTFMNAYLNSVMRG